MPPGAAETRGLQEVDALDGKEEQVPTERREASSGLFVAVAYSNCNCFFLGRVLNTEDGIFGTFLEQIVGKNGVFCWPSQATVETVDAEQVFITDLEAEEANTNQLTFPRLREV